MPTLSKWRGRLVHFMKWNILLNGSRDSPERKCLGEFASACLKAKWITALDRLVLDLHPGTVAGLDHKEMEEPGHGAEYKTIDLRADAKRP